MLVRQRKLDAHEFADGAYAWFLPLFAQLQQRFLQPAGTKDGFPCVFAQNAFRRTNIRFSLVPLRKGVHDLDELRRDLGDYLDDCEAWDGNANSSEPLLAVFEKANGLRGEDDYRRLFDAALQHLIDNDPLPWPEHTHTDPASPYWSMCFREVQIFINVSHPAHVQRRSRNLCDTLVLVINPRERFDAVAGNHSKGHAIRQQIRSNVDLYDRISRSPRLDHYLSGGLEWPQYMLPDDNVTPPRKCPLHFWKKRAANEPAALPAFRYRFAR
ncbi:YqcI/YcgG family protein [Variovorax sp. LjRoot84]|uniref:YqcI/YcgG family protein n=1 Tax=unclassified Variovorax TaxID=663243 RepID=UPI003ECC48F5